MGDPALTPRPSRREWLGCRRRNSKTVQDDGGLCWGKSFISSPAVNTDTQRQQTGKAGQITVQSAEHPEKEDYFCNEIGQQECVDAVESGITEEIIAANDSESGHQKPDK